jgi:hypothetical protein
VQNIGIAMRHVKICVSSVVDFCLKLLMSVDICAVDGSVSLVILLNKKET